MEKPILKQLLYNGTFVEDWEIELQEKRQIKKSKEKRLFQTNELNLGGLNKSII